MKIMLGFTAMLAVLSVMAADLTTKTGKTYKEYEIDRATPHGLSIFHESGTAVIPYAELPDELRGKYAKEEKEAPHKIKTLNAVIAEKAKEKIKREVLPEKKITLGNARVVNIFENKNGITACPGFISGPGKDITLNWDGSFVSIEGKYVDENVGGALVFISGLNLKNITNDSILGIGDEKLKRLFCWEIGVQNITIDDVPGKIRKFTVDPNEAVEYYFREQVPAKSK